MRYSIRSAVVVLLALLVMLPAGYGQNTSGTISGVVKDESGAVLPGVSITILNKETGSKRSAITDDSGHYTVPQLVVGLYEVQAELSGFNTAVVTGITLQIGQEIPINPVLKVGELSEKVTVTGEAAMVDTTSATVATVVDEKKIRDLPLNGRSFTQLALLQEAVISPTNQAGNSQIGNEGQKISISGTRITQTSFLLDGTDIRNQLNTTPGSVAGVLLGVDTVREFNVETSVASAEFGLFTGGVVNAVTRSGTNEFHGSLFEFHRNSFLDARNFFDITPNPPNFIRNQFGFTLGGPIIKDKTFFFGSYEGLRNRLTETATATVPDANARLGIFPPGTPGGNVTVSPLVKPYLDTWALPNARDFGDGTGEFIYSNYQPTNEHYFMTKVDHQISTSDSVFVRFTWDKGDKSILESMALWGRASHSKGQFTTIEEKKIISSTLLNTVRFAFNRTFNEDNFFNERIPNLPDSMKFVPIYNASAGGNFGSIGVGGIAGWGPSTTNGKANVQNRFEIADTVVWTRGSHSMKFGGNMTRYQYNFNTTARYRGAYSFTNLRNFLLNVPTSFQAVAAPTSKTGMRENIFGFFITDDYRMKPTFTWNLGLRYEFITNPVEVNNRISNLDHPSDAAMRVGNPLLNTNPSLKSFAPRVGFAWDVFGNGKTSLRGGGGIFYELIQPVSYYTFPQSNAPLFPQVTLSNPVFPDAYRFVAAAPIVQPSIWVLSDPKQPYVMQYNLTLQQEVFKDTVITAGYQGSHGIKLARQVDANTSTPIRLADGTLFNPARTAAECPSNVYNIPGCRRNPNFSQMRNYYFDGNSFYNAFKFGVRRRFADGLQLQSAYTYSRSIDDGSNANPFDSSGTSPNGVQNQVPDDHKWDRGLSSFDARHVWSFNATYEFPFGANGSGALNKLISGWQVSTIVLAASGPPLNALMNFDNSRSRMQVDISERPSLKPGANNNPVIGDGREPSRYYDPSVFMVPAPGTYGNAGRGTIIEPGVSTVDISLVKQTNVNEQTSFQFRAEFFNIANRANFSAPSATVFNNTTGVPLATAGRITSTTTTARQIQFGLKVMF